MAWRITKAILVAAVVLLAGCAKEPPKCSDEASLSLVRKIVLGQMGGSEGLSEKEIQDNMKIDLPRASAFDEKIKKFSCEAKLIAGGAYQLPITYESQLDDKGNHVVAVGGISPADLVNVKVALIDGIKKGRAPSEATAKPSAPLPTSAPTPTPVVPPSAENARGGLCAEIYKQEEVNPGDNDVQCSNVELGAADKELNGAYRTVSEGLSPDRKAQLKSEQVAWIKEKDAKCSSEAAEAANPRQETIAENQCLMEMTKQRITYLKNFR